MYVRAAAKYSDDANGLSGPSRNYGEAPRAPRRPPRKARGGTIPGVFDRRATPRGGMHRRPNAAVITRRATKLTRHKDRALNRPHRHRPWRIDRPERSNP